VKTLALILAALLAAFGASPASATMIRWEGTASIQRNIDFATLGQVAGYFDFDTVSATIVGVNMTFTPVAGALHPLNGDPLPIFTANAVSGGGATGAFLVDWSDGPDFAGDYLLAVVEASGLGQVGQTLDGIALRICAVSDCRIRAARGCPDQPSHSRRVISPWRCRSRSAGSCSSPVSRLSPLCDTAAGETSPERSFRRSPAGRRSPKRHRDSEAEMLVIAGPASRARRGRPGDPFRRSRRRMDGCAGRARA